MFFHAHASNFKKDPWPIKLHLHEKIIDDIYNKKKKIINQPYV